MAINFKFPKTDFKKVVKRLNQSKVLAEVRTLNEMSRLGVSIAAKAIQKEIGVRQGDVRFAIKRTKATGLSRFFRWSIKTKRFDLAKPRQLKNGVSFVAKSKRRKKITNPIRGGSRPFIIKKTKYPRGARGENISRTVTPVVYRDAVTNKIKTIKGSSLAFFLDKLYDSSIKPTLVSEMPNEFIKQLRKSTYRGKVHKAK